MPADGYHVVFDVSRNVSQVVLWSLIPLVPLLVCWIGWGMRNSGDLLLAEKGLPFLILGGCAFALSLVMAGAACSEYFRATAEIKKHTCGVAEGTVSDFVPMPPGGHSIESFKLAGTSFQYGSGWGAITFNSAWNRGLIHDGTHARICYNAGGILRIETK
jgi:hypothetical protein